MDTLRATLAPSVRVRRRTGWQHAHVARLLRAHRRLQRFAALGHDAVYSRLARHLAPLRRSLAASPYWRERLCASGLSPRDLRSLGDLVHFPTLDRDALRDRWDDLPAFDPGSPAAGEMVAVQTSGSTGQPITVLKDAYDTLHMWAVLRFFAERLGVALPRRPRVVLLCSLTNGIEYSVRLPALDDGALHRISLCRPRPLERLRRARPDVVFSDPAGLHWLAGQDGVPAPRLVLSSAQHLSPHQRAVASEALRAPIVNYYASADTGPLAWECEKGGGIFHVLLPDVWVESLSGELVVTRLRPTVLPLLRYRTGDPGDVVREDCACGYRGPSIRGFQGRRACFFETPDGRAADAWQLAWLFKHYRLTAFRLTQHATERFELEVVTSGEAALGDLRARLCASLQILGWPRVALAVREVEALPTHAGKPEPFRRAVVS